MPLAFFVRRGVLLERGTKRVGNGTKIKRGTSKTDAAFSRTASRDRRETTNARRSHEEGVGLHQREEHPNPANKRMF
jgi:hypothetical protein